MKKVRKGILVACVLGASLALGAPNGPTTIEGNILLGPDGTTPRYAAYAAKAHPELTSGHGAAVTYNVNLLSGSMESAIVANEETARKEFLKLWGMLHLTWRGSLDDPTPEEMEHPEQVYAGVHYGS